MDQQWEFRSTAHLLASYRAIMRELRERGVTRTGNAPTGDYAEYLVNKLVRGELAPNSEKSFDVTGFTGTRYQVKSRVIDGGIGQRQLSPFRSWDFDLAAIVLFNDDYGIRSAVFVPVDVVRERSRFVAHVNGHVTQANDDLLGHHDVQDVTARLREVAGDSHVPHVALSPALDQAGAAVLAPASAAPSPAARVPTQQSRFHGEVAKRVSDHLKLPLQTRKGTSFESMDGSVVVLCFSSKRHGQVDKYWYSMTAVQVATCESAGTAYLAFGCASAELVFTVPWNDFSRWTKGLNRTENDRGGYWHIIIERAGDGFELRQRDGYQRIDLEPYKLRS